MVDCGYMSVFEGMLKGCQGVSGCVKGGVRVCQSVLKGVSGLLTDP